MFEGSEGDSKLLGATKPKPNPQRNGKPISPGFDQARQAHREDVLADWRIRSRQGKSPKPPVFFVVPWCFFEQLRPLAFWAPFQARGGLAVENPLKRVPDLQISGLMGV